MSLFPNAFFAKFFVLSIAVFSSLKLLTIFIPIPPPPALALIKMGYPMSKHFFSKFSEDKSSFFSPGQIGKLLLIAFSLATSLFPIDIIVSGLGPIQIKPESITF